MIDEEGEETNEADSDLNDSQLPGNRASVEYTRPKTARKRGSRNDDDELIAALKKKAAQDVIGNQDNEDEDKLFLLSLLSEIKKVPPQNKLQLRANFISTIAQAQQQTMQQHWPPFPTPHLPYNSPTTQFPSSDTQYNIQPQQYALQHNFMQHPKFSSGRQKVVNSNEQSQFPTYSCMPSRSTVHSFSALDHSSNYDSIFSSATPSPAPSDKSCISQLSDYVTKNNN